jgi:hypothetical protein
MRLLSATALLLCFASSLAQAAGNVNVYMAGDSKPKVLTNAARLIDVVGSLVWHKAGGRGRSSASGRHGS